MQRTQALNIHTRRTYITRTQTVWYRYKGNIYIASKDITDMSPNERKKIKSRDTLFGDDIVVGLFKVSKKMRHRMNHFFNIPQLDVYLVRLNMRPKLVYEHFYFKHHLPFSKLYKQTFLCAISRNSTSGHLETKHFCSNNKRKHKTFILAKNSVITHLENMRKSCESDPNSPGQACFPRFPCRYCKVKAAIVDKRYEKYFQNNIHKQNYNSQFFQRNLQPYIVSETFELNIQVFTNDTYQDFLYNYMPACQVQLMVEVGSYKNKTGSCVRSYRA